jgi:hypothetical protein
MNESTQELINKITDDKHRQFLELYPKFMEITKVAEAMNLNRHTIHMWLQRDEHLSNTFAALKKNIEAEVLESHLKNIRNIAFDPKIPPQTRILASIFETKALDARYKDRVDQNIIVGDIIFKTSMPPVGEKIALPVIEGECKELKEGEK